MKLTVLGCDGSWPGPGGVNSGYLLQRDGFNLWVDAGGGTMGKLQEHISVDQVHAVLITHAHADHFVDLFPFFVARHYGGLGADGLPLYMPPGLFDSAAALLSEESQAGWRKSFALREIEPSDRMEIGPFAVRAHLMAHFGISLGYRIEAGGSSLAYTGDSGPAEEIVAMARDADVLLAEATWQDEAESLYFHMKARQAGDHAARAGAKRLILTHIEPTRDQAVSRDQAAEAYSGPIDLAKSGMQLDLGE